MNASELFANRGACSGRSPGGETDSLMIYPLGDDDPGGFTKQQLRLLRDGPMDLPKSRQCALPRLCLCSCVAFKFL